MRKQCLSVVLSGLLAGLFTVCDTFAETPGERFRQVLKEIEAACAKRKLAPNEVCGQVAKLKPFDPLATQEGRFAHSIKIPNPVQEDSGYKPGMTPEQYFEHLCQTEAGEFIYKTVENVEGLYMMRPRKEATYEYNHLYASEDPYGHWNEEAIEPEMLFVTPSWYSFLETQLMPRSTPDWKRKQIHPSIFSDPDKNAKYARYSGYDGQDRRTMQKVYDTLLRSRYGYTWRGITRPHDRELGIAGSELLILDLQTHEVLGVHRGYTKFEIDERLGTSGLQWAKRCPPLARRGIGPQREFIFKVLKPTNNSTTTSGQVLGSASLKQKSAFPNDPQTLIKIRCESEAGEWIYSTIEDVDGFFRRDDHLPDRPFIGGVYIYDSPFGGVNYRHPLWMFFRLGLEYIEYELNSYEKAELKTENKFGRFDMFSRKTSPIQSPQSRYVIWFRNIGIPDEEKLGVHGRQIDVMERSTDRVLATRKEFIWINPDSSRPSGGYHCPAISRGQETPTSFLAKVFNPETYGCWLKGEALTQSGFKGDLPKEINACEEGYWHKKGKK